MPHPSWPSTGESLVHIQQARGPSWSTAGQHNFGRSLLCSTSILSLTYSLSLSQCWCGSYWHIHHHRPYSRAGRQRGSGGYSWNYPQDQTSEDEASADSGRCMNSSVWTPTSDDYIPQDQYVFIHDAILESVTCGDTQILSSDLRVAINRLKDEGFTHQFKVYHQHSHIL